MAFLPERLPLYSARILLNVEAFFRRNNKMVKTVH